MLKYPDYLVMVSVGGTISLIANHPLSYLTDILTRQCHRVVEAAAVVAYLGTTWLLEALAFRLNIHSGLS